MPKGGNNLNLKFITMDALKVGMELKQHTGGIVIVNDTQFSFGMYWNPNVFPKKDLHWEIVVWANGGQTSVINKKIPAETEIGNVVSEEIHSQLFNAMLDWSNGYQLCSCCKTRVKKESIAGRYFAGSYCAHCWETKYKAIEARETYN
jgi:hypothetical protein